MVLKLSKHRAVPDITCSYIISLLNRWFISVQKSESVVKSITKNVYFSAKQFSIHFAFLNVRF